MHMAQRLVLALLVIAVALQTVIGSSVRFTLPNKLTVQMDPWGSDSVRIRVSPNETFYDDLPGALLPTPLSSSPEGCLGKTSIGNGNLQVTVSTDNRLQFTQVSSKTLLFSETKPLVMQPASSDLEKLLPGLMTAEASYSMEKGERFYGLGQHKTGHLDNVGQSFGFQQHNTEVFIPLVHSSRGYSYLWNMPSYGNVTLDNRSMSATWFSQAALQLDMWVSTTSAPKSTDLSSLYSPECKPLSNPTKEENDFQAAAPSPWANLMRNFVDVTGHSTIYPYWSTGFWQSRNRYRDQSEFLAIATNYSERNIPVSVLVIDYYSWAVLGDEVLDPKCWKDPAGMVEEVHAMGMKVMVSPYFQYIQKNSVNYQAASQANALATLSSGQPATVALEGSYVYDVFSEDAQNMMFNNAANNYLVKYNMDLWWLDDPEPGVKVAQGDHLLYHGGKWPDTMVASMFPWKLEEAVQNGMAKYGRSDSNVMLSRSAWAGAQRLGAAVWSGDISSTFDSLSQQIRAGLNIAMAGITYWTTDICGYHGADMNDPQFQELSVRWFQYGAFCPLFRLHGCRSKPGVPSNTCGHTCSPNEIWIYPEDIQQALLEVVDLRESLRDYVYQQYCIANETGMPIFRPLFFDFPNDTAVDLIEDEFMFGADWLVAPITTYQARSRMVYLPKLDAGLAWRHHFTGEIFTAGQSHNVTGPLNEFPLFQRVLQS